MTKYCNKCKQNLPLDRFGKDKGQKDGLAFYCRSCVNAYNREYSRNNPKILEKQRRRYANNKEKYRNRDLIRLFGITLEYYNELLLNQSGVCAICKKPNSSVEKRTGKPRSLSVDHDHGTGKVRGLLCSNCNLGIGSMKDSISILESAIEYLKNNK